MRNFPAALSLSSLLAVAGAVSLAPTNAGAQPAGTYVACNQYAECWRVHQLYAYGPDAPITYYNSDWYVAHRNDAQIHWLADPDDGPGYYDRDGRWHADPAARVVTGGAVGAGLGAAIGCLVTLPIGCAPGAAVGAAVGGGSGVVVGAATTPRAQPVAEQTYVACNQFGECWRVHRMYAYGEAAPITYYNSDWYVAHRNDAQIHWLADPDDAPGYYDRDGRWHADPAARVVAGGAVGASLGAAIGCLVTLPIGCAPGAAVGAAVGGGSGVVAGAASTPP